MDLMRCFTRIAVLGAGLALAGCGLGGPQKTHDEAVAESMRQAGVETDGGSLFDLFSNQADPNTTVEVNKYIWKAALEVLNFLPIESADPFSGVLVTGFGTPPGGGTPYRATILVQDPALDARSLKIALATRGGAASPATTRAVEDAILTRARQLRLADAKL